MKYSGAMDAERVVDARGLVCPMPIIELAKAIRSLDRGAVILLVATDPAALADVRSWCEATGNLLAEYERGSEETRAYIRKA